MGRGPGGAQCGVRCARAVPMLVMVMVMVMVMRMQCAECVLPGTRMVPTDICIRPSDYSDCLVCCHHKCLAPSMQNPDGGWFWLNCFAACSGPGSAVRD